MKWYAVEFRPPNGNKSKFETYRANSPEEALAAFRKRDRKSLVFRAFEEISLPDTAWITFEATSGNKRKVA